MFGIKDRVQMNKFGWSVSASAKSRSLTATLDKSLNI